MLHVIKPKSVLFVTPWLITFSNVFKSMYNLLKQSYLFFGLLL